MSQHAKVICMWSGTGKGDLFGTSWGLGMSETSSYLHPGVLHSCNLDLVVMCLVFYIFPVFLVFSLSSFKSLLMEHSIKQL